MRTLPLLLSCFSLLCLHAEDWPQFLGPRRDGSSQEQIAVSWTQTPPAQLWKLKIGAGFASPVISQGTVVMFHREGASEILLALDAKTGKEKWRNPAPTAYRDDFGFDEGPRATPCISSNRVYAMGAEGLIRCVDLHDGRTVWSVPAKKKFNARKGFFGMASSPLVLGRNVILNIGGENDAGIVALDIDTGELRWKASEAEASYASPVTAVLAGKPQILVFTREGLAVLEPQTGHPISDFHWRSRMNASVNAATPIVLGSRIFLTASYDTGAVLLEWKNDHLEKIWSGDDSLSSHYATPVSHDGFLFGFHGRQEYGPALRCIEAATGKVRWSEESFGAGTLLLAGDQLLILRESGELLLAGASPAAFRITGRSQILGSTRAAPALSGGCLFARDNSSMVCVRLPGLK